MDCMASRLLENFFCRSEICTRSGFGSLQSRHGADLSPKSTLLVTRPVKGLVLVSEV
ncbi:hypothetical protein F2Q70_00002699 [Brassica cretica]|uniref:Uncharacterized protein n=1 Tax=Brassica cretica TaxID=69181 RepID=A0A8S9IN43_BRACR|nr:hypothetical protein F2Q70_00002699 [Brassica cretica]